MKNILLIEGSKANKPFPNLALMKISAYHKKEGDLTFLNTINASPDKIYVSCPFSRRVDNFYYHLYKHSAQVTIGGYGKNGIMLPRQIEGIMPDYDLYNLDYSMGFTSRGCINKCPFCVVPRYEGQIRNHQPITQFLNKGHKKVILLDNTFTNSPKFKENSDYLIKQKIKVNINQGINVRTMTEEKAKILKELKPYGWTFKGRMLHIAWDNPAEEDIVRKGIQKLLDAGFLPRYLSCYVLVNYNSTFEEDLHRCNTLWNEYNILPFIMSYNGKHPLQRWANRRYIKYTSWEDYDAKKTR